MQNLITNNAPMDLYQVLQKLATNLDAILETLLSLKLSTKYYQSHNST